MADIKEAVEKPKGPNEEKPSSAGPGPGLFALTIDASTGQITGLEKVDSAGGRRQLSEQEKASLQARKSSWNTLEAIVEQAFEAGIACALGSDDAQESEDDAEVRRILPDAVDRTKPHSDVAPTQRSRPGVPGHGSAASYRTTKFGGLGQFSAAKVGGCREATQSGSAGPAQH